MPVGRGQAFAEARTKARTYLADVLQTGPPPERAGPSVPAKTPAQAGQQVRQRVVQRYHTQLAEAAPPMDTQFSQSMTVQQVKAQKRFEAQLKTTSKTATKEQRQTLVDALSYVGVTPETRSWVEAELATWRRQVLGPWQAQQRVAFYIGLKNWSQEMERSVNQAETSAVEAWRVEQRLRRDVFEPTPIRVPKREGRGYVPPQPTPTEYPRTYRRRKYQLTPYERKAMLARQPEVMKQFTQSVKEVGLTGTLMKGAETLMEHPEVVFADILGLKGKKRERAIERGAPATRLMKQPGIKSLKQSVYFPIGFAAGVEAYVRPEIATPTGAVMEPILHGGRTTQAEYLLEHPGYALGALYSEYLQAKAVGWALGKAWGGVKRVVPESVKQAVKFGRVAKTAYKAKITLKSKLPEFLRRGPITRGEIAIPPAPERMSVGWLRASKAAWELTQFPRTGGVWLARAAPGTGYRAATKALPLTIIHGTRVIAYKQHAPLEAYFTKKWGLPDISHWHSEVKLTPFVSQQLVTRMGVIPYAPSLVATGFARGASRIVAGLGATAFVRSMLLASAYQPKLWQPTAPKHKIAPVPKLPLKLKAPSFQPTFAYEREKFSPLRLFEMEKPKKRAVPALKLPPKLKEVPVVAPKLWQPVVPKRRVVTVPKQVPRIPVPHIPTPYKPTPTPPKPAALPWIREGRYPKRGKGLFGKWFYREHPIPLPSEMLRGYGKKRKTVKFDLKLKLPTAKRGKRGKAKPFKFEIRLSTLRKRR